MTDWQSIETAPRDGTKVLGYWVGGEIHTGHTDGENWFPAWEHQDDNWAMPSHWMPLPPPPSLGRAG